MGLFSRSKKEKLSPHEQLANAVAPPSRFETCGILRSAGIPNKVWLDDATLHFGVSVMPQTQFIIVPNVAAAGAKLLEAGYRSGKDDMYLSSMYYSSKFDMEAFYLPPKPAKQAKRFKLIGAISKRMDPGLDLSQLDPAHPSVCLLSAQEYFYEFPANASEDTSPYPELVDFLVAMMTRYLHAGKDDAYKRTLSVAYFQQIYDPDFATQVRQAGFEQKLPAKYRQLHSDLLKHGAIPQQPNQDPMMRMLNQSTMLQQLSTYESQERYVKQVADFEKGQAGEATALAQ